MRRALATHGEHAVTFMSRLIRHITRTLTRHRSRLGLTVLLTLCILVLMHQAMSEGLGAGPALLTALLALAVIWGIEFVLFLLLTVCQRWRGGGPR